MGSKLKVKSLRVQGFRGFTELREFDFDAPSIFLFGDNRTGKSSTLNALEWCLFGDSCIGLENTGIRERITGWKIKNLNWSGEIRTEVVFSGNDAEYKITRKSVFGDQQVSFIDPTGTECTGKDAESRIYNLIQCEFNDFKTSICQHQETVRDLITGEPSKRNDAFDRLFGLSELRQFTDGLKSVDIKKRREKLETEIDKLSGNIDAVLSSKRADLERKKEEAKKVNIQDSSMNLSGARKIGRELITTLTDFCQSRSLPQLSPHDFDSYEAIPPWIQDLENTITDLRGRVPGLTEQKFLEDKRIKLSRIETEYASIRRELDGLNQEKDEIVKTYGDETKIDSNIEQLEGDIKELRQQKSERSAKSNVVTEAMKYLQAEPIAALVRIPCPVCGEIKKPGDLLQHVQEEWEKKIRKEVEDLENQIVDKEKRAQALQLKLKELNSLISDIKLEKGKEENCRAETSSLIGKEIALADDLIAIIGVEISELENKLEKLAEQIKKSNEQLNNAASELKKIDIIYELIRYEQSIKDYEAMRSSEDFKKLLELKNNAAGLEGTVKAISEAISAVSKDTALNLVSKARDKITNMYKNILDRPDFDQLEIKVGSKKVKGVEVNDYEVKVRKGSKENDIISTFNQADMNCVALSIFLGLASTEDTSHNLDFIILDDPSQSLDTVHKQKLVEILNSISDGKQILVATMDKEFQTVLSEKVTKIKRTISFANWDIKGGITYTLKG